MFWVGKPTLKTACSSNCGPPLRAPTTRSVPETVLRKLWRDSCRTRSTPSKSITLQAIDTMVSTTVARRFINDCQASRSNIRPSLLLD